MKKTIKKAKNICIICNDKYGIYYGNVIKFDVKNKIATVEGCRHVARWYGGTGGITSLAALGLCGPKAGESRVGAPTDMPAILTGIVNIFPVSVLAQQTFDRCQPNV
jgi:hypothetical protein